MAASDWDAFWRNAGLAKAQKDSGPQDAALKRFWFRFFKQVNADFRTHSTILDIACGSGAVMRHVLASLQESESYTEPQIFGLDTSSTALLGIRERHPGIQCIVASADSLPFHDRAFDLVTSQFGIEYAGMVAMHEAARVVRPGGIIAAVMHLRNGAIYNECAVNLDAINGIRQSGILHCFEAIFRTAQAVMHKQAGADRFRQADRDFGASVAVAEQVLQKWGKGVADGMLFRIYNDIAHMYKRYNHYDPEEVFKWIRTMCNELDTYAGRMTSMLKAALDEATMNLVIRELAERKFTIRLHEQLIFENSPIPAAWALVGDKTAS